LIGRIGEASVVYVTRELFSDPVRLL
jgi:hypothetical protein